LVCLRGFYYEFVCVDPAHLFFYGRENLARFQTCAAKQRRSASFWVITQRVVLISYRRFGTTYRSHIQESRWNLDPQYRSSFHQAVLKLHQYTFFV
jgi:hypothetical protein